MFSRMDMHTLGPLDAIPPRSFETPRLRLRAITRRDAEVVFRAYGGDPVATKYMAWKRPESPKDLLQFVEGVDDVFAGRPSQIGDFAFIVEEKQSCEVIGGCGIGALNDQTVGGGYILHPRYWGQGFAAEAWRRLVDWAKSQPRVMRIQANHHPDNPASGAVMRKVGLCFESIRKQSAFYPNLSEQLQDDVIYAWTRR
jgi:ribosomal-protein-alanine N-acetyltransferase